MMISNSSFATGIMAWMRKHFLLKMRKLHNEHPFWNALQTPSQKHHNRGRLYALPVFPLDISVTLDYYLTR